MDIDLHTPVCIDYLRHPLLEAAGSRLGMLRLDEIHPLVSGNKWFKLKENISKARAAAAKGLLSFGGAYSNHLLALAAAANACGMRSVGMVRGLHGRERPTPTLEECRSLGMELVYVSRETYDRKEEEAYLDQLQAQYPGIYIVPEGGDNAAGRSGAGAIAGFIPAAADLVALPVGTGTTFAGIRNVLPEHIAVLGFPVMKGGAYLLPQLEANILPGRENWQLEPAYHCGGFARYDQTLIDFMNLFFEEHNIPLDFVYTAKMMYGIFDRLGNGDLSGRHIIAVHTGGLQGNRSLSHALTYVRG